MKVMLRMNMAKAPPTFIAILVLCSWISIAIADYQVYQDPKQPVNRRVKDLLKRMTLEEKIGQMTQIDRIVASAKVMKKYNIGKYQHHRSVVYCIILCLMFTCFDLKQAVY